METVVLPKRGADANETNSVGTGSLADAKRRASPVQERRRQL